MEKESRMITLPSKGLPYKETIPSLYENGGMIKIYPMTAREEKLLAGAGNMSITALMTSLFNNTVDEKIPFNKLLSDDRFFILMQLRIFTWGGEYATKIQCQDCNHRYKHTLDLNEDLDILAFESDTYSDTYEVELEKCGDLIELRRLTGEDEIQLEKAVKKYKKQFPNAKGDPMYSLRFAKHIVSINSDPVPPLLSLVSYIDNLHVMDVEQIRTAIESNKCGYELLIETECPECYSDNEAYLEFTAKFFRPRSRL